MRKYPVIGKDGNILYRSHIGVNHTASGMYIGGMASSYTESFDDKDLVNVESGIGDIRYCVLGNISETYEIFKTILLAKNPQSLFEYCACVQETILKYFGDYSNITARLENYPSEDDLETFDDYGKISALAHKNAAMCVERSMVAQNLLKTIGLKTIYKMSGVIVNGKMDAHAYNLLEDAGKYYIFDVTIPTIKEDTISPIICEIPKEVFDKIKSADGDIGESVKVTHYNPLQKKDYEITYDAGRKELYEASTSKTK